MANKRINQERVIELLSDSTLTGHFTNYGPNVKRLEKITRKLLQVDDGKAVICTDNATSALHVLTAGIQIAVNSNSQLKWATQSFTFPSSAQGGLAGAKIIDIDKDGGLDLNLVDNDIDGIIVTNVFGNVVDIDKYTSWGRINKKFVIFDNAATSFTFYKGKNSINYGVGSVVSFHHTKPIGFGEGGVVIVDKEYEAVIRRLINFGIDDSHGYHLLGSNYKMSDVSAAYIIQYLDNFQKIVTHHQSLYNYFKMKLCSSDNRLKMYPTFGDLPFLSCFCLISPKFTKETIEQVCEKGIYCRKYYKPLVSSQVADLFYNDIICLPCTMDMNEKDIDNIISIINGLII